MPLHDRVALSSVWGDDLINRMTYETMLTKIGRHGRNANRGITNE